MTKAAGAAADGVLEIEQRGAARWLWLNRPDVRNALNDVMVNALAAALRVAARDRAVRLVVLAGRGAAFCAGGDLARMEKAAKLTRERSRRDAGRFARLLRQIDMFPKPVVARVHGPAFAGGMGLAAVSDVLVASEAAEFCLPEVRIGLVPAMISPYIVRALGERQARRYMLSAERLSARDAWRLGFVQECVAPDALDATVDALGARLAQGGPQALARSKKLLARVARAPITPKLATETAAILADTRAGAEAAEGIRAFLEKRRPNW